MVFVQVGVFSDNGGAGWNTMRFPFTSGRWRIYYIGSSGVPRSLPRPTAGDLRILFFPDIAKADPQTTSAIIQRQTVTSRNVPQPNQLFGITLGTVNAHKNFAEPWCLGEIDAGLCYTMFFASAVGAYASGNASALYTILWFDAYRVD